MNEQDIELLAPAGKWEVLKAVAQAGADAVYIGGKRFNMRMLKDDFNFSDPEIEQAATYLHRQGKKLYITVNNWYEDREMEGLEQYLLFLQQAGVDAIIVQDMAIMEICRARGLEIPLHASVQAGISNLPAVEMLEASGFSRVILSKNNSLDEIRAIAGNTHLGIEYFVHGDICIAHAGQCYMSSFLGNRSGNRGECMKPCRWQYSVGSNSGLESEPQYWLAHKDLCLYPYLQPMIEAGVTSFKIEGRMRGADYLSSLIKIYRQAFDNLIEDSTRYCIDPEEMRKLENIRVRDFTSGNLITCPDIQSIGLKGEREPFFPTTAFQLNHLQLEDFSKKTPIQGQVKEISVKTGSLEGVRVLSALGVDQIILGYDQMRPGTHPWTAKACQEAIGIASRHEVAIVLESPRILSHQDVAGFEKFLEAMDPTRIHAVIAHDLGAIQLAESRGFALWGGYGLNITNSSACQYYLRKGLGRMAVSQELDFGRLHTITAQIPQVEITVHGPSCGMITDVCIPRAVHGDKQGLCPGHCDDGFSLKDLCGHTYMIRTDEKSRSHIYYPYERCLFPYLHELTTAGLQYWQIDGQYYEPALLKEVVTLYQAGRQDLNAGQWPQTGSYKQLLDLFPDGLSASPVFAPQAAVDVRSSKR